MRRETASYIRKVAAFTFLLNVLNVYFDPVVSMKRAVLGNQSVTVWWCGLTCRGVTADFCRALQWFLFNNRSSYTFQPFIGHRKILHLNYSSCKRSFTHQLPQPTRPFLQILLSWRVPKSKNLTSLITDSGDQLFLLFLFFSNLFMWIINHTRPCFNSCHRSHRQKRPPRSWPERESRCFDSLVLNLILRKISN